MHINKHTYAYLFITCIHTHRTEITVVFWRVDVNILQLCWCLLKGLWHLRLWWIHTHMHIYTHIYAYLVITSIHPHRWELRISDKSPISVYLPHMQIFPARIGDGQIQLHCNTLQHTATHCNALQHSATHMQGISWDLRERIPGLRERWGGWGRVPFSRNLMSPTPRRKWYLTTGRRFH